MSRAEALRNGERPDLCGQISTLNDEMAEKQRKVVLPAGKEIVNLCLYDNDTTPGSDLISGMALIILSFADIFLIRNIVKRRKYMKDRFAYDI